MATDDYEIVSFKDIEALKRQIKDLQKKSLNTLSSEIVESMDRLTEITSKMFRFFKTAAAEMRSEDIEGNSKKIENIEEKLNQIMDQNKVIAEGIVALADVIKERQKSLPHIEEELSMPKEETHVSEEGHAEEEHIDEPKEEEPSKKLFTTKPMASFKLPDFGAAAATKRETMLPPPITSASLEIPKFKGADFDQSSPQKQQMMPPPMPAYKSSVLDQGGHEEEFTPPPMPSFDTSSFDESSEQSESNQPRLMPTFKVPSFGQPQPQRQQGPQQLPTFKAPDFGQYDRREASQQLPTFKAPDFGQYDRLENSQQSPQQLPNTQQAGTGTEPQKKKGFFGLFKKNDSSF